LLPYILFQKYINILALAVACPGNRHCAKCIGTLSFPMQMSAHAQRRKIHNRNQEMAAGRRRLTTGHHHQHFAKHEVQYLLSVPSGGGAIWGFSFHKETRYTYGVKSGVDESTDLVQERRRGAKK